MKKFIFAMVIILLIGGLIAGIGCAIYFSGNNKFFTKDAQYVQKTYTCSANSFNTLELDISGAHNLILRDGERYAVEYSDSLISKFNIKETDGKLKISERNVDMMWYKRILYKSQNTDITITMPKDEIVSLNASIKGAMIAKIDDREFNDINLSISGSGNFELTNITANNLNIKVSGAVNINAIGDIGNIYLQASGAAQMSIAGNVKKLNANISGSVKLDCTSLYCDEVEIGCSGSSKIKLSGAGKMLTVSSSGSTDIDAFHFPVTYANIRTSGSIHAEVCVDRILTISASGGGEIKYMGDAVLNNLGSNTVKISKVD